MFRLTPYEKKNYDVFDAFRDFENSFFAPEFNQSFALSNACRTDIREEEDKYILEAEMPGFDKEDIHLDLNGDYLTLSAEHKTEKEEKDKHGKYICKERSYGSYQRRYDVSAIDTENIHAEYKNGVLELIMPKKTPSAPASKRLEIK